MPGYPCCCGAQRGCGDCNGTAPQQYQLTVPAGVFSNNDAAFPTGCGEACADYSGVYLLDHAPSLTPIVSSDVVCIWESPNFDVCYQCSPGLPPDEETPICSEMTWYWRVELADVIPGDGIIHAYVLLLSRSLGLGYTWQNVYIEDCSQSLEMTWTTAVIYEPMPGCVGNAEAVLSLEAL